MSFENSHNSDGKLLAHPEEERLNYHARYFLKHDLFNNDNQTATAMHPDSRSFVQGGPEQHQRQRQHFLDGNSFTHGNKGTFEGDNLHASHDASSFDDFKKRKKLKEPSQNNCDTYDANSNVSNSCFATSLKLFLFFVFVFVNVSLNKHKYTKHYFKLQVLDPTTLISINYAQIVDRLISKFLVVLARHVYIK